MRRQITTEQIVQTGQDGLKASLYVRMTGTVVKYHATSMTADIQPMTNDVRGDLETGGVTYEPWPVLLNVKIAWPRFGAFVLVGPLNPFDPVTLEAFDLDPNPAWKAGKSNAPVNPADVRRLSGSYWSATPTNLTGPIKDVSALSSVLALLGLDGDTAQILFALGALTLGKTGSNVAIAGGANPLVPAPWATGLAAGLNALCSTAAGLTPATNPANVMANLNALVAAIGTTLGGALGALPADATTATTAT